ncbi:MAG: DUF4168 domain-containing protein [Burkholderiales bacterium]|nr:DUF4168 domain-containing protein [Burkholderiales bacterium]
MPSNARHPSIIILCAAAALSPTGLSAGIAMAQNDPPASAPTGQKTTQTDETTVKTFAVALAAVKDVQTTYIEKIQNAKEPDVAAMLQREAQSEMIKVVQKNGLSVEQYNLLAQQMQTDPDFRQQVERATGNP